MSNFHNFSQSVNSVDKILDLERKELEINNSCLFSMALFEFARMARLYTQLLSHVWHCCKPSN